jgi:hypothetical protein
MDPKETLITEVPSVSTVPGFAVRIPEDRGVPGGMGMVKLFLSSPQPFKKRRGKIRPDKIAKEKIRIM